MDNIIYERRSHHRDREHQESRNPFVPVNFFNLYGTFLDQLKGRSYFSKEDLSEERKAGIYLVEQVIQEKGYISFFDNQYIHEMNSLSKYRRRKTANMEKEMEAIPGKIERLNYRLSHTLQRISENKAHKQIGEKKEQQADIIHEYRVERPYFKSTKEKPPEKLIAEIGEYKKTIDEQITALREKGVNGSIIEKLNVRLLDLNGKKLNDISSDELFGIWLQFDRLNGAINIFNFYSDKPLEKLSERKSILVEMIMQEDSSFVFKDIVDRMSKDELIYLNCQLEDQLNDLYERYSFEEIVLKEESLQIQIREIEAQTELLDSQRNDISQSLSALRLTQSSLKDMLAARKKYGENWRDVLIKFWEMEKEVYIEWGKRMKGYNIPDPNFIPFGEGKGYF